MYRYIHNAVVCLECSVSFLSEFHEVECLDGIGLGCGVWEMRMRRINRVRPTLRWGRSPNFPICLSNEIPFVQFFIVVVECCCILIIYYCWQAPGA